MEERCGCGENEEARVKEKEKELVQRIVKEKESTVVVFEVVSLLVQSRCENKEERASGCLLRRNRVTGGLLGQERSGSSRRSKM